MKGLLGLERENARLTNMVGERDLAIDVMKEIAGKEMVSLSAQYPRFRYRHIQVFLERQGLVMSADRLWRQAKLQVPRRRPCRRIAAGRPRPVASTGSNQVRAYDFVFDACANGQQLDCLTVVDEYTRVHLAIDVAGAIRSARVIEVPSGNKTPGESARPQQYVHQPGAIFQDQFDPTKFGRSHGSRLWNS